MKINKYLVKLIQTSKELENLDFFMGKAELSKTEFRLLQEVIIERGKGRNIISSELARRLGITRSAVSQIVTKLEEKNIVKRTAAEHDRKIAYIKLSDYAASMFEQQQARANVFMEKVIGEYGVERFENLIGEYDDLCKAFEKIKSETEGEELTR